MGGERREEEGRTLGRWIRGRGGEWEEMVESDWREVDRRRAWSVGGKRWCVWRLWVGGSWWWAGRAAGLLCSQGVEFQGGEWRDRVQGSGQIVSGPAHSSQWSSRALSGIWGSTPAGGGGAHVELLQIESEDAVPPLVEPEGQTVSAPHGELRRVSLEVGLGKSVGIGCGVRIWCEVEKRVGVHA